MKFGNWTVVEKLGEGHFGAVYKARRPVLDDPNTFQWGALKVLHPGSDALRQSTMRNEILKISQLSHDGLSEFKDSGVEPDGNEWFVMGFVPGESLQSWVHKHGPLAEPEWLDFCRQILEILKYTWKQGLAHLDIKPDNIIRTEAGKYVLVDFGLSSKAFGDRNKLANQGWSAPEQFKPIADESPASDVFSVALTIYFAATAQHPWAASTIFDYREDVFTKAPNLEALAMKYRLWLQPAFAKMAANRPTAAKLLDELTGAATQRRSASRGIHNPQTWAELAEIVFQECVEWDDFFIEVVTDSQGNWKFEYEPSTDEELLTLSSTSIPPRSLMPVQRKKMREARWRAESEESAALVFKFLAKPEPEDLQTVIMQTLASDLALSIENIRVICQD
jgi:serine/threonine protein kinase